MKKTAFIYNPHSGKGKIGEHLNDIVSAFAKEENEITLVPTRCKNYCRNYIINEGHRFDEVCVAGGDGTVNEAVNGLMRMEGKKPVLGYIPMGTTNDFAASCMIPMDAAEAAATAASGKSVNIDCGKFNDEYFSYVAAFGIFTDVAYDTPQQYKNLFGKAAYIVEGIKRLGTIKTYKIEVKCDDRTICGEFIFGMAANSNSVAGVNIKSMEVDLSDGLFEVLLIKKISKPTDLNLIVADLLAKKTESDYYYMFKTNKLTFSSDEKLAWTLDGEFGGEHNVAVIENINAVIKIKVAES